MKPEELGGRFKDVGDGAYAYSGAADAWIKVPDEDHDPGDEDRAPLPALEYILPSVLGGTRVLGGRSAAMALWARLVRENDPSYVRQRGVDFPCEKCGAWNGSTLDNRGFYRCHGAPGRGCGYPAQ